MTTQSNHRQSAQMDRKTEWLIYTCRDCGEIRGEDPCVRCGDDGPSVMTVAVHGQRLKGAVEALRAAHGLLAKGAEANGSAAYAVLHGALDRLGRR